MSFVYKNYFRHKLIIFFNWCRWRDLNPQPPAYKADALPLRHNGKQGIVPRYPEGLLFSGCSKLTRRTWVRIVYFAYPGWNYQNLYL